MYIEIKTQLIVDDEEIDLSSCIKVTSKSGEVVVGELDCIDSDDIDIESKMFGTVRISQDNIDSIEIMQGWN